MNDILELSVGLVGYTLYPVSELTLSLKGMTDGSRCLASDKIITTVLYVTDSLRLVTALPTG